MSELRWFVCQQCGIQYQREYQTGRPSRYCSLVCKYLANEAAKKGRRRATAKDRRQAIERARTRTCPICGRSFRAQNSQQMYCSISCANVPRNKLRSTIKPCVCQGCGKTFMPKEANRTTYCSRECAFAHWKATRGNRCKVCGVRIHPDKTYCDICKSAVCEECGRAFIPKRFAKTCSEECRSVRQKRRAMEADAAKHPHLLLTCRECGAAFTPEYKNKHRDYCSDACADKHNGRVAKATRRARMHDVEYESVDPYDVFKRDGWRCHICGCRTPQRLRGTLDNRAPELDHITPLALGGPHTYANTACACRKCNQQKGAQLLGQMRLTG